MVFQIMMSASSQVPVAEDNSDLSMCKNIVYIATSIDNFISTKEGGLDWLDNLPNPDKVDFGYSSFMETIDALIMGRNTYEKVLSFGCDWPYSKKVFVLSNTLTAIEDKSLEGKVDIVKGDLKEIVKSLNDQGFKRLYIDGGKTIQSFMEEDLIDELILSRVPLLLGDGIPLFPISNKRLYLEHIETKAFSNGLVQSHYRKQN
jgi:dihydrofolate reductase